VLFRSPDAPVPPDLPTRAAYCRATCAASPLAERFAGLELPDLESEARAAADWIKERLAEGRPRIGLIALDRMLARRLRALLERESILVRDETGWSVHTSAASHVLGRMHDLIEGGFYFRDVLDMLKSAYCFADRADPARALELPEFEAAVHRHSVLRGALPLAALARRCGCVTLGVLIERLADALAPLAATSTRTLADWQTRLLTACDKLGVTPAWRADSAGVQLLERLDALARGVARDPARYTRQAWRHWLDMELERSTFRDDDIDSPVRLTHLQAAWLRDFDAVALLGADAGRLPPAAQAGPLGDAVRTELGLPARAETHTRLRAVLADLIARTPRVLATWHAPAPDEDATPAPWLGVLDTLHRLAWGTPLLHAGPVPAPQWPAARAQHPPAPVLDRVPARLSASGWQRLVDCPYRFFARDGLGLGEADEAREALEKRHYGELLHRILSQFHGALPRLSEHTRGALRAQLDAFAEAVFGEAAVSDYLARAWHFRWLGHREAYLDWALRREAEGYQWLGAEMAMERSFDLAHATVTLYGRLDRLDRHGDGVAVVDYKTQPLTALRARLKVPGEDVQLACYAWLAGAVRAELVSLDDVRVDTVVRADGAYFEAEMARLRALLDALHAGAALPAQGTAQLCVRCEFQGLCRRAHWSWAPPPATH
jgi:ATP-dependent helicase/nuclease subunit B